MNIMGCLHSWKNWIQLCSTVEFSLPPSALPCSVLLASPQISCMSCNTYLDLGELKTCSMFKYIFNSRVFASSEQKMQTPYTLVKHEQRQH